MDDEDDTFEELMDDMLDQETDQYDYDDVEDLYDFDEPDEEGDLYDFDQPNSPPDEAKEVVRPSPRVRKVNESLSGKKTNLPTLSHDAAELKRRLRTVFLQAAKYGFREPLEKALPVLRRMYDTHPKQTGPLLDFYGNQFYSPLMYACEAGHVEVAEYLLNNGATAHYVGRRLTKRNKWNDDKASGLNAMHLACIRGKVEIVKLLITHTPNSILRKTLLSAKTVRDKWTPIMYAVRGGHIDVVKVILETKTVDMLAINKKGQTVLHIAACRSQLMCLKEIHANLPPADITQVKGNPYLKEDKNGRNVLHRVCSGPEGSVETLQWLLEVMPHLKTPEILNMGKNSKGYTMLLLACDNNNVEMVRYLLSLQEVEVSACTADGKTGLHLAAIHDYPEVAQELIQHHITLTAQDIEHGDTALHIALRKSSLDVAEIIRSSEGAEELRSIPNKAKKTPDAITPEQIIPKEIEKLGEAAVRKYMQALRKGKKKKMPRCNLIVLGEQRVGKTSLLRLVMGKEFIAGLESTRGIDNEHVDVVDTKAICSLQWQEVRPEDQAKDHEKLFISSVAEEIKDSLNRGKRTDNEGSPPDAQTLLAKIDDILLFLNTTQQTSQESSLLLSLFPHSVASDEPPFMHQAKAAPRKQPSKKKPSGSRKPKQAGKSHVRSRLHGPSKPTATVPRPVVQAQPPQVPQLSQPPPSSQTRGRDEPLKFSRRVSKSVVSTVKQGAKEEEPMLHLNTLDFAGQKVYRPMHHCFIVRRALYLVVFNLQKIREALKCPNPDQEAALEEIGYWLHSIHAHVHKICREPHLKRVILVGTHKAPQEQKAINDEEMVNIHKALKAKFVHGDIANDLRYVYPNHSDNGVVFAAVENSADGEDEKARQESGALLVQSEIQKAWQDLPFKDEEYPTTWLRFETSLTRMRGSHFAKLEDIKQCHIGEDDEKEIELALGFFHDTGTLVYMKKLPSIYLNPSEKEKLNDFVLLDPTWLMKVMRIVMELKMGVGQICTTDVINLKETGTMKSSILKECWVNLCKDEVSFHKLCLILQSFCLIFPLSSSDSQPAQRSASSPATTQLTAQDSTSEAFARSQSEGDPAFKEDTTYLIPSMLPHGDGPTEGDLAKYKITFCFNFQGFLPVEVYHRLLCLMLRDQKIRPTLTTTGTFTEEYFQVKGVHDNNWMVQKVDDKLKIFVADSSAAPKIYISLIHTEYLRKICDEKESSLQGLKYVGGPEFSCSKCKQSGVLPYVSYSKSDELEVTSDEAQCEECLQHHNINLILDPEFKEFSYPDTSPHRDNLPLEGGGSTDMTFTIQAHQVVVAESGSSVSVHPTSSGTDQMKVLLPDHEHNAIEDGHFTSMHQPLAGIPAIQQAAEPSPSSLGIDDLQTVLEELVHIEKKWFHLGLALGLRQPTLKKIKDENDDTDDCKLEMLTKWLDKVEKSNPSWRSLVDALRNPTIKHKEVADVIEEKYL